MVIANIAGIANIVIIAGIVRIVDNLFIFARAALHLFRLAS